MGSFVLRILGVVGVAALTLTMLGSGVASAQDPLIGKSYSDAAAWISKRGGTPVIATVSGDQLGKDDCTVVSWQKGMFLNSAGRSDRKGEYYLHLNCNNHVASAGKPGNSVMSPEGAQGKKDVLRAADINKNPAWCEASDAKMQFCVKFCKRTGLCEV
jgi:hypothetical protein